MTRPNIIWINPDEMRADLLGCYGAPVSVTPNMDRLAREGVRFDQCHVQHTVCTPSRCSFTSGWYPHVRGHRTLWHPMQPDEPTVMRYLKQDGYQVHWWGKNDLLAPGSYAEAITEHHRPSAPRAHSDDLFKPDEAGYYSFLRGPADGEFHERAMADDSIRLLEQHQPGDAPFFHLHTWGMPHCPFTCPQPWYDLVDPDDLPPLRALRDDPKPDFIDLLRRYRGTDEWDVDHPVFRKIRAVYYGMAAYVDHQIGRLLDALDRTGLADNTWVYVFTDHGDWAGDYGLVEKWSSGMDDCLTRSPLLIRGPGVSAGHVAPDPVELFDIMPTTLDHAGIEARHTHFARSLTPQLAGDAGDPDRAVFTEGGYDQHEPHCFEGKPGRDPFGVNPAHIYYPKGRQQQEEPQSTCRSTSIRTASHRLTIRSSGADELYDLRADPEERHNRVGAPELAQIEADLRDRLMRWYLRTSDVTPWQEDPRGHPEQAVWN